MPTSQRKTQKREEKNTKLFWSRPVSRYREALALDGVARFASTSAIVADATQKCSLYAQQARREGINDGRLLSWCARRCFPSGLAYLFPPLSILDALQSNQNKRNAVFYTRGWETGPIDNAIGRRYSLSSDTRGPMWIRRDGAGR